MKKVYTFKSPAYQVTAEDLARAGSVTLGTSGCARPSEIA